LHIGRGLYYGSYKSPRVLVWSIGVIILVLMMATLNIWPNCEIEFFNINPILANILPINKSRTKAILRIGPHIKEILDVIICGMLGDFWADSIKGKTVNSTRFQIEQSLSNSSYIHSLTLYMYNLGYCARPFPSLVEKKEKVSSATAVAVAGQGKTIFLNVANANPVIDLSDRSLAFARDKVYLKKPPVEKRFNYRLTLFTFTSFNWIYDSFYTIENGVAKKKVPAPFFINEYITPLGLAHWIMQDGSFQKGAGAGAGQGIFIATNSFTFEECKMLALILTNKYGFRTSVIKTGHFNQWRISIWKESMPVLAKIVGPYIIPEMVYKLKGYL